MKIGSHLTTLYYGLPTVKTLTSGHFLPLKPFSIGHILTLFENCFIKWMSYLKKNWDQDQYFFKKSRFLTKKEPFFETKSKITKVILNSYMVSKKTVQNQNYPTTVMKKLRQLHSFIITVLWYFWFWTVFLKPLEFSGMFSKFLWNHQRFQHFVLVFLGKSWNH